VPQTLTSYDPATGAALGAVTMTAPEELEAVVRRARAALAGSGAATRPPVRTRCTPGATPWPRTPASSPS
jgi:acyl-CoA reductase-like NAD-dependent aldehyde dehydrogenase